jgi:hypothetical protein
VWLEKKPESVEISNVSYVQKLTFRMPGFEAGEGKK